MATRHILTSEFRKGFYEHFDILLNKGVLMGTSGSGQEPVHPASAAAVALSTLLDQGLHEEINKDIDGTEGNNDTQDGALLREKGTCLPDMASYYNLHRHRRTRALGCSTLADLGMMTCCGVLLHLISYIVSIQQQQQYWISLYI